MADGEVTPFTIAVPDSVLDDLRARLGSTRWPETDIGEPWQYGTDLGYLEDLCATWRSTFDWGTVEDQLNSWENVRTTIDGQPIHALVARSAHDDAFPLVITHGWPGSVIEFLDVIEPLRDPTNHGGDAADAFHVVCPSLPGFGWSGPTTEPGWCPSRIARAWKELMARLGFSRYGAQGGDWGSLIAPYVAAADPDHCAAIHITMALGRPPTGDAPALTAEEMTDLADGAAYLQDGAAYTEIQGKNPQTLGYGLTDSPAGLAAWIVEKFRAWTDNEGSPDDAVSRHHLLANLTTYWVTNTALSSTRIYWEAMKAGEWAVTDGYTTQPTGVAVFPKEIAKLPRSWVEQKHNVTHWSRFDRGGHFASLEEPDLFVQDLRDFFRTVR